MPVRLATPRLSVVVTADSDEAITVQTIGADMIAAEATARKHKWGTISESPVTWLSFLAWSALRRTKQIPETLTYTEFSTNLGSITDVDEDDDEEDEQGTPTRPGPGSG
jgi:hypothetical protein